MQCEDNNLTNELPMILKADKNIIKSAKLNAKSFEQQLILKELYNATMPLYITKIDFSINNSIILSQKIKRKGTEIIRNVEVSWDLGIGGAKIEILK